MSDYFNLGDVAKEEEAYIEDNDGDDYAQVAPRPSENTPRRPRLPFSSRRKKGIRYGTQGNR